jgi:hypothetical protein
LTRVSITGKNYRWWRSACISAKKGLGEHIKPNGDETYHTSCLNAQSETKRSIRRAIVTRPATLSIRTNHRDQALSVKSFLSVWRDNTSEISGDWGQYPIS